MSLIASWKQKVQQLKVETYALYLAYKDPRVPWYARAWIAIVVAYAFSPIDLIPDFIPVLGYLDDLVLLPLGVALALRLIPRAVLEECREKAAELLHQKRPVNWTAGVLIIAIWLLALILASAIIYRAVTKQ
jgi:uncharacterized membrane protein YkvA (DUF1232 family)